MNSQCTDDETDVRPRDGRVWSDLRHNKLKWQRQNGAIIYKVNTLHAFMYVVKVTIIRRQCCVLFPPDTCLF